MTKINDGGPAFPTDCPMDVLFNGMSLRYWTAVKAMQAIISSPRVVHMGGQVAVNPDKVAIAAFNFADAMLKEDKKKEE